MHKLAWGAMLVSLSGACAVGGPGSPAEERSRESRPDNRPVGEIKQGTVASDYAEAVLVNMKKGGWVAARCSGALIAPRVVLTAGHCVAAYDGWDVYAPFAAGGPWRSTEKAQLYDWTDNGNYVNPKQHDLGVLILNSPIHINSYPTLAAERVSWGTQVVNVGRKRNGVMSYKQLYVGPARAVSNGWSYGHPFAYAAPNVIEPGDSGGPVLLPGAAPRTLVAVNSGAGYNYELLARVDLIADWLQARIDENGGKPAAVPPPPSSCAHALCEAGDELSAACDPCVDLICAKDPYCCQGGWDSLCVGAIESVCAQSCEPAPPPESEDPCKGVSFEGECSADQLSWCENDKLNQIDCANSNKTCGWDSSKKYYNCL
jgi:hypothetical protein